MARHKEILPINVLVIIKIDKSKVMVKSDINISKFWGSRYHSYTMFTLN